MTFTPARDLFADAESFPSLFDGGAPPAVTDVITYEPTSAEPAAIDHATAPVAEPVVAPIANAAAAAEPVVGPIADAAARCRAGRRADR